MKRTFLTYISLTAITAQALAPAVAAAAPLQPNDHNTTTPIKHVVVIYGENRTFDHLFATYKPPAARPSSTCCREGIVKEDGTPGPNFAKATQFKATRHRHVQHQPDQERRHTARCRRRSLADRPAPQRHRRRRSATIAEAQDADGGVLPRDLRLLTTGATGLVRASVDTRIANVNTLPSGPFQLTPGVPYDAYASSPVHRFYQAWQQSDCNVAHATAGNPSGCLNDLFPWVEVTIGAGSNGSAAAGRASTTRRTGEGSTAMGFYNMLQGDMPISSSSPTTTRSATTTTSRPWAAPALNSILAGFADAIWYSDGKGNAATPPANQIENPNPQRGTNNWYTQDGYRGGIVQRMQPTPASPAWPRSPAYLDVAEPTKSQPNCEPGHYYLLNNYNPGYLANGQLDTTTTFIHSAVVRPQHRRRAAGHRRVVHLVWRGLERRRRQTRRAR